MSIVAAAGRAVQAAAPYILDQFGNMIANPANQSPPSLGTQQTDEALRSNDNWTAGRTRDQLAVENQAFKNRADDQMRRDFMIGDRTALSGNNIANAGSARVMAANAQNALNQQYMTAGDRLNNAARDSAAASNAAMSTIASLFR
jgi:hypothetical protein